MLTYINKQGVQSDRGFIVQRIDRFNAEYREGTLKIVVGVESGLMGTSACLNYSRADFQKWSNSGISLSEAEQERVISNFREALKFQGITPIESNA